MMGYLQPNKSVTLVFHFILQYLCFYYALSYQLLGNPRPMAQMRFLMTSEVPPAMLNPKHCWYSFSYLPLSGAQRDSFTCAWSPIILQAVKVKRCTISVARIFAAAARGAAITSPPLICPQSTE